MDKYESIRSLPFPTLAGLLGLDLQRFKRRKTDWQGYCPVHQSKTNNNCFAYADDGRFHCFSCEAKGRGGIDLYKAVRNVGFQAAVEALGATPVETAIAPVKDAPKAVSDATGASQKPFDLTKYKKHAAPCQWLEQRVPDASIRERYGVFFYQNDSRKSAFNRRVMIPVRTIVGELHGYLGRSICDAKSALDAPQETDTPKYLFPRGLEKSRFLFGAHELTKGLYLPHVRQGEPHTGVLPLKVVYLLESPFAVMHFVALGFPAVSPFGWSVSNEQLQILATLAKGIVYLPDKNKRQECGHISTKLAEHTWVRFPPLPDGIDDPEQLTREQILALTQ